MDLKPPLSEVVRLVASACADVGVEYVVVGALAAGAHGYTRSTKDADVLVDVAPTDRTQVARLLDALAARRFRFHRDALLRRASEGRTFLFTWLGAVRTDILLTTPGSEWEPVLRHRVEARVEGHRFWVAAPEDVVLLKAAAGREKDLEAVREVLDHNLPTLDLVRLRAQAARLALRAPDLPARLEALIEESRQVRRDAAALPEDELPPGLPAFEADV